MLVEFFRVVRNKIKIKHLKMVKQVPNVFKNAYIIITLFRNHLNKDFLDVACEVLNYVFFFKQYLFKL